MPGGDGTGPLGISARTGWGRGLCRGLQRPGSGRGAVFGSGGQGCGWSWRNRFWSRSAPEWLDETMDQPPFESETRWLDHRLAAIRAELQQITARLDDLQRGRVD